MRERSIYHANLPVQYTANISRILSGTQARFLSRPALTLRGRPASMAARYCGLRVMMRRVSSIIAILLVLCIVGISGVASAQSVLHESHHNAHHQAATHGSVFCSWMCAAGQAGEAATVLVPLDVVPHELVELISSNLVQTPFASAFVTRGPPVHLTI